MRKCVNAHASVSRCSGDLRRRESILLFDLELFRLEMLNSMQKSSYAGLTYWLGITVC